MVIVIVKLRAQRGRWGHAGTGREISGGHGIGAGARERGVHGGGSGGRHGEVGVGGGRAGRVIGMGAVGWGQGRWAFSAIVRRGHRGRGRGHAAAVV